MPQYLVKQEVTVSASGPVAAAQAARRLLAAVPDAVFTVAEVLSGQDHGPPADVDLAPLDDQKYAAFLGVPRARCGHPATNPVTLCGDCGAILDADGREVDPLGAPVVPLQGDQHHHHADDHGVGDHGVGDHGAGDHGAGDHGVEQPTRRGRHAGGGS